ncbi:MAG: acetyl-CoA carboxylase biotin carboxyl carrier protein [Fimbriimonadaceae bacterium]|nr:acetyl-CoA carboxylase biotin carboxyl carrier protein [Alphaproteobacteria bacterium]
MAKSPSTIDSKFIRELADLLTETDLSEIEVEQAGLRIRVARDVNVVGTVAAPVAVSAPPPAPVQAAASTAGSPVSDPATNPGPVKSPMVGTGYLSPEPGAKPFVEVGSSVTEGQTVLIVEAMKTMNAIPAPKAGTVTAILIEDAQPVEFGEPLLIIE